MWKLAEGNSIVTGIETDIPERDLPRDKGKSRVEFANIKAKGEYSEYYESTTHVYLRKITVAILNGTIGN